MKSWAMLTLTTLLAALLLEGCATTTAGPTEEQRLVESATLTMERFFENSDFRAWYRTQRKNIKAIFIVPQLLRGAFLVGAAGGKGVLLAQDFVHGGWSPPAFYSMSVGSFGLQAGADASELILMVQSLAALERFHGSGTVKMGLDAGLTMGSLGDGGAIGYDIVTLTSAKGVFAGMSLAGLAVTASNSSNEAYYGTPVKPEQILSNISVTNPGADRLRATVERITPENR